jgi:hypothetical protein
MAITGNSEAGKMFQEMIDYAKLGEMSHIPMLTEEQAKKKKEERFEESLGHQEKQQEVMQKFAVNKDGNQQFGGQPPKDKPKSSGEQAKAKAEEKQKNLEVIEDALAKGQRLPLVLGESEIDILNTAGMVDEDGHQLFNPFHSKKSGRFAKGGGGGGRKRQKAAKDRATKKARSKRGGVVKTTGKVLGIGGLGLAGLAIIGAGFDSQPTLGPGSKAAQENDEKIAELTKDWPKFSSSEEAIGFLMDELESGGLEIPDDIVIDPSGEGLPGNAAGMWDTGKNKLTVNPRLAGLIQSGDPLAMHVLIHELAHSNQEFVGDDLNWGNNSEMLPDDAHGKKFGDLFEGQNDLMSAVIMSDVYGKPMDNQTSLELSNKHGSLLQSKKLIETGMATAMQAPSEVGYQDQAEVWAALATAGAQQTGVTPMQYLKDKHAFGLSPNESHQVLVDLFPEDMRSSGHYNERVETTGGIFGIGGEETVHIERTFPTQRELRQWMRSRGYVDPRLAYQQMLEEAAR